MFLPTETVVANLTLERLDVTVSHDVEFQFIKSVEFFGATHVIFEWTFILLHVAVNERMKALGWHKSAMPSHSCLSEMTGKIGSHREWAKGF